MIETIAASLAAKAVEWAASRMDRDEFAEKALGLAGYDIAVTRDWDDPEDGPTDEEVEDLFRSLEERLDADLEEIAAPWEEIHELPDTPGTIYVWRFDEDVDDEVITAYENQLQEEFVDRYRSAPQALHIFLNELDDIRDEMTPEDVADTVEPFLSEHLKKENR